MLAAALGMAAWAAWSGGQVAIAEGATAPPEALLVRPGWALRAAVDAMERSEAERARALLAEVSRRHPLVADHADLLHARLLLGEGDAEAAAAHARAATTRHAGSPLLPRLHAVLGDTLHAAGDASGARAAWEAALAGTREGDARAELLAALAASREKAGADEAAAQAWLEIWREHPLAAPADRAEARLRALEDRLGRPLRSGPDWKARGDVLRARGRNELAVPVYEAALTRDLAPRTRRATLRARAHGLFALRRYEEAIPALEALAPDPDAAVSRARAVARAGDVPRAIEDLLAVADGRWGRSSVYARYLAALLLEDEDDLARARVHFEKVAGERAHARYANPSLWSLGWTAWRSGRWEEARERMAELAERERASPIRRLRPLYWGARAAEKLGDAEAAAATWRAMAAEYPFTYYGWLARQRLAEAPPEAEPPHLEAGPRRVPAEALARARILLEAGLAEEAALELDRTAGRARSLRDRLEVARLLAGAGRYHRAQRLVVDRYHEDLARGVAPGHEELWWLAWPAAFGEVMAAARPPDAAIDRAVVSAVMREESGYRPEVTSPAGARGLLQIMPDTGRRLAAELGLGGFEPADLYLPRTNIRLGTFYLDQLMRQFDGRLVAAVASYNAGPHNVARWLVERPGLEDDEWVEAVPYSQTRSYVKRVMRSIHAYRMLH